MSAAWERHAMCESAFIVPARKLFNSYCETELLPHGPRTVCRVLVVFLTETLLDIKFLGCHAVPSAQICTDL